MVQLDEAALGRILAFASDPSGRLCCRAWAEFLFESLQLEHRIRVHKLVRSHGSAAYHHSGVRALGQDFEECVAYQFVFDRSGTYHLQWSRTFDQWSADNERQVGRWRVVGDKVRCESTEGPASEDGCVRFARPGLVFELPVEAILKGHTAADDATPDWEYGARGLPAPQAKSGPDASDSGDWSPVTVAAALDPDARFVEVDGELHEVSRDIRTNWPEADWERLMMCRVRFGIRGQA